MQRSNSQLARRIGARVRELRESLGLSQAELGQKLNGRTQGNIAQLEQGARKLDLETLAQLAELFHVGLEFFFEHNWKISRRGDLPVLLIDGLDLQQAFDQYLAETPFENLRGTEEVRLKALANPDACSRAMAEFARNETIYYSYRPTPREWHHLERRIARRRGAFRSMTDVINALELLRHSQVLQ